MDTAKCPLCGEPNQCAMAADADASECWCESVIFSEELLDVFGNAGFDPAEDIEGIAINRWGHAEAICYPGFAFSSGSSDEPTPGVPIYDAGQHFGRIAFAHTDLNGFADNQGTTRISHRAVKELLD